MSEELVKKYQEETAKLTEELAMSRAENMDLKRRTQMVMEQTQQLKLETEMLRLELERSMRMQKELAERNAMMLAMQEKLKEENRLLMAKIEEVPTGSESSPTSKVVICLNREGVAFKLSWLGELDSHGLPKGAGAAKCSDGRTYVGVWSSGKTSKGHISPFFADGKGQIQYADGGIFQGTIRSSSDESRLLRRGEGSLRTASGLDVEGSWNDQEQIEEI